MTRRTPLDALARMLWGTRFSGTLLPRGAPLPAGHVVVDRFMVLPSLQRPRFLLPLGATSQAQARLLQSYNDLRYLGPRSMRTALARALQIEPLASRLGTEVVVCLPADQATATLRHLVAQRLDVGVDELVLSTSIREAAGGVRPTVTLADRDGTPVLFVKVGERRVHRTRLGQEAEALTALKGNPVPGMHTPSLVIDEDWHGRRVMGVSALPIDAHRVTVNDPGATWPKLSDLQAAQPMFLERLNDSEWMAQLRRRTEHAPDVLYGPLTSHLDRIAKHFGRQFFAMGRTHGDWLPWNMAWGPADELSVWDWEYSHPRGPLLLDPLHWHFGVATMMKGRSFASGLIAVRDQVANLSAAPRGLTAVFLAEHAVRRAEEVRPEEPATTEVAVRALRGLAEAF